MIEDEKIRLWCCHCLQLINSQERIPCSNVVMSNRGYYTLFCCNDHHNEWVKSLARDLIATLHWDEDE